ncbi:MAG: chitobiase/beta-hexosaminidase C-terminal domain-containing protein [Prevotella sp.]|nr:chitobiase/beta-hexosaminidase C-terminal domain-containing protein [Prevotella sp.]
MKKNLLKMMLVAAACLMGTSANAVTETYDFQYLQGNGYTTINSSGKKTFEGKDLNVISSFTNASGTVGSNVGGRIAALYQNGNGNNFWMRDNSRPWFVSAGKTSYMAFDNLKAGDVVTIIGAVYPLTILCDNVIDAEGKDIASGTTFNANYKEDAPLVLTAKADGYIYGSYGPYTSILKIIVETSAAETANDPIISVTGANGPERTVVINPNNGSVGTAQTAYYTLDGSDPTKSSTEYTKAITVSDTTTVKAIAYCGDAASNVVSLKVEAGTTIKLNDPVLAATGMTSLDSYYSPVVGLTVDNSDLIGAPTADVKAMFNDIDITADLLAATFVPSADGTIVVTTEAEGYESASATMQVYHKYDIAYKTADYSSLATEAEVLGVLGEDWTSTTTRWANWNKNNETYGDSYVVYSYGGEAEGNIYLDQDSKLRGNRAIQFVQSFGFGRNINSGVVLVFMQNTGSANDVTLYRVISSKGGATAYRETYVSSNENGYSEYGIPAGETLCQVIVYTPDMTATGIKDANSIRTNEQETVYSLQGVRVEKAVKGLYIVGGRKVIVK